MVTVNQSEYAGANISTVIDFTLTEDGYYSEEPVSVELAKQYCRILTGNLENDLVGLFIQSARRAVEQVTGLSLVPKSAEVMMICPQEGFEIPFGPVTSDITFVDIDSQSSSQSTIGFDFPKTRYPYNVVTTATYTCGYPEGQVPPELKNAILFQVSFLYENRGDNSDTAQLCPAAWKICQKYSRVPFFQ